VGVSESLRAAASGAPALPGVYSFLDHRGAVLYIGKAQDLRARLGGHLSNPGDRRHQLLLERAVAVEWTITRSEVEALVLEAELIRIRKPPLNVRLRSGRKYPYLEITTDEEYPRLFLTRKPHGAPGRPRFGPYPDSRNLRKLMEILLETFPLRRCGGSAPPVRKRPCLMGQLGRCMAPCTKNVEPESYGKSVSEMIRVLKGDWEWARERIVGAMEESSSRQDYEEAARLRDLLGRLASFGWPAPDTVTDARSRDAVVIRDNWGLIMRMRGGRFTGVVRMPFDRKWKLAPVPERLSILLRAYYTETDDIPRELLLPELPDSPEPIVSWLGSMRESPVRIRVPKRGGLRDVVELAERDLDHFLARLSWKRPAGSRERTEAALEALADIFHLPDPPLWMTCLDASTIQGSYPVAALVSFRDGRPDKSGYRRFSMPPEIGRNDPAMIASAVGRYVSSLEDEHPAIFLIDGGITQLRAAVAAAGDWAGRIRFVSLAKKEELLLEGVTEREIRLDMNSLPLMLLRHMRDESHRFVLHYHQQKRSAGGLRSVLDDIPGIGSSTKLRLLNHFGSAARVAATSIEDMMEVPGIGRRKAIQIREFMDRELSGGNREKERSRGHAWKELEDTSSEADG